MSLSHEVFACCALRDGHSTNANPRPHACERLFVQLTASWEHRLRNLHAALCVLLMYIPADLVAKTLRHIDTDGTRPIVCACVRACPFVCVSVCVCDTCARENLDMDVRVRVCVCEHVSSCPQLTHNATTCPHALVCLLVLLAASWKHRPRNLHVAFSYG